MSNITDRPPQARALPARPGEFALACKSLQQRIDLLKARFLDREPTADLLPDIEEFALRARRLCDHAKHKIRDERARQQGEAMAAPARTRDLNNGSL
jgi:hypothetical protein